MKYQIGTELINEINGEVVVIVDLDSDYHTRNSDYLVDVVRSTYHPVGIRVWMYARVIDSSFRPLTAQEKVLYGR